MSPRLTTLSGRIGSLRLLCVVVAAFGMLLVFQPEPALADGFTQAATFAGTTSMRLDASGNPVIGYVTEDTDGLARLGIIHCNDPNCEGADESFSLPTSGGFGVSLALDASGNPVVSYWDKTDDGSEFRLMHCDDAACTGGGESVTTVVSSALLGFLYQPTFHDSWLVLDVEGNPVISTDAFLVRCNDPNCAGGDESVVFDLGSVISGALVLDSSGNPVLSVGGALTLSVVHCNDPNCTGNDESVSVVDSVPLLKAIWQATSISLDAAGNPVVAYIQSDISAGTERLKILHCNDPNCVGGDESITTQGLVYEFGIRQQMVLDVNGYPVISYLASATGLNVLHCNDANCAGGDESVVTAVLGRFWRPQPRSLQLDAAGNPVVAQVVGGIRSISLLHCNDTDCAGGDESIAYPAVPAAPVPSDLPEMALNVSGGTCDDATRPTTCDVSVGASFVLSVDVLTRPAEGYIGMQTYVDFGENLIYQPTANVIGEIAWPDCEPAIAQRLQFDGTNGPPPFLTTSKVHHSCLSGLTSPLPISMFEGTIVTLSLDCSADASSTIVALLPQHTPVTASGGALFVTDPLENVIPIVSKLAVNCVAPAPVGGIALDSAASLRPLETPESSSSFRELGWAIAAGASAVALGSAAWWARRRQPT